MRSEVQFLIYVEIMLGKLCYKYDSLYCSCCETLSCKLLAFLFEILKVMVYLSFGMFV